MIGASVIPLVNNRGGKTPGTTKEKHPPANFAATPSSMWSRVDEKIVQLKHFVHEDELRATFDLGPLGN